MTTQLPVLENSTVDSVQDGCPPGHSPGGDTAVSSYSSIFASATDVQLLVSEAHTALVTPLTVLDSVQGSARDDWMSVTFSALHCLAAEAARRVPVAAPIATAAVGRSPPGGLAVCLEELLPLDSFQQSVQALFDLFQHRSAVQHWEDWLDTDLRPLITSPHVSHEVKFRLRDVRSWWLLTGLEDLSAFTIYTDGSAMQEAGSGRDLSCCAWSFCVWAE